MSRQEDPLIAELRRWGYAQANRYAYGRSHHVLENAREYSPKSVERALMDLVQRDGRSRRRLMGAQLAGAGMRSVPTWAVDPIRGRNDADRPHDNPEIAVDIGIPDDLRWIDRALASMARQFPLRAHVVRTEFTVAASQTVKARIVQEQYGGRLTLRQYRYEMQRGIDNLRGSWSRAAA